MQFRCTIGLFDCSLYLFTTIEFSNWSCLMTHFVSDWSQYFHSNSKALRTRTVLLTHCLSIHPVHCQTECLFVPWCIDVSITKTWANARLFYFVVKFNTGPTKIPGVFSIANMNVHDRYGLVLPDTNGIWQAGNATDSQNIQTVVAYFGNKSVYSVIITFLRLIRLITLDGATFTSMTNRFDSSKCLLWLLLRHRKVSIGQLDIYLIFHIGIIQDVLQHQTNVYKSAWMSLD